MSAHSREIVQRLKVIGSISLFVLYGIGVAMIASHVVSPFGWLVYIGALLLAIVIYLFWPILRSFRYGFKNRPKRAA